MTLSETYKIIQAISLTYPNTFRNASGTDLDELAQIWAAVFERFELSEVKNALADFIRTDTKGFAPVPGQLIELITRKDTGDINGNQAWALVSQAISNSLYHAEEEFSALPEVVRDAVGSPGALRQMAMMPSDTLHSVEKSHFIRIFDAEIKRRAERIKTGDTERLIATEAMPKIGAK